MDLSSQVHVIVRHVGERTKKLCSELLSKQIPVSSISFVSATPFAETVRCCFEKGMKAGKKWTLCIDADVVPTNDCIQQLYSLAEAGPDTLFEAQGLVVDKLFNVLRPAGNHIYRTELFTDAILMLEENKNGLRPETGTMWSMAKQKKRPWLQGVCLVGLHDYGQYYCDLIRKVIVQYQKFPHQRTSMEAFFDVEADKGDLDYSVALQAVSYAKSMNETDIRVDSSALLPHAQGVMETIGIAEKQVLYPNEASRMCDFLECKKDQEVSREDMQFIGEVGLRI